MKNKLLLALLLGFLWECSPKSVDPLAPNTNPTGEWVAEKGGAGGYNNFGSFKNFQYTFEVENANQLVTLVLASPDIDVQYILFDKLGQRIATSNVGRNVSDNYTLKSAGTYRVVVAAARQAVGKFSLSLMGTKNGATLLPSQFLQSDKQAWGGLGGGGRDLTFKNHFYDVEVTEDNTALDIELESADTDVALYLYNSLGQQIDAQTGVRYEYVVKTVNKGTYRIMAATNTRGSKGNYTLRVAGNVQNLKRVEAQSVTVAGTLDASSATEKSNPNEAYDLYSIDVTATNAPLDIDLSSPDMNVVIRLLNNVGAQIGFKSLGTKATFYVSNPLPQGTYQIKVLPQSGKVYGKYSLSVHGQFANFKKL